MHLSKTGGIYMTEFEQDIKAVEEVDNPGGIALELLKELKEQNVKSDKHNFRLFIIIIILVVFVTGLSVYHEFLWSRYDTVVVDSQDGGYANYIGNDGDISYGEDSSTQKETNKQKQTQGNAD